MTDDGTTKRYDAIVVGGGAAGLNGALMLARARRRVLVVDAGEPRNAPAEGVHGLLGREGTPPAELLASGRDEVRRYGGEVRDGRVAAVSRTTAGFAVDLEDGARLTGRRLLLATGIRDELPDIPGLRERWGRDVVHCPYCHGWEVRDEPIGVIATGPMALHQASMFRQWSDDIVLFTNDAVEPTPEQVEQLEARGIRIVEGAVRAVEVAGDAISGVVLASGARVERSALVVMGVARVDLGFAAGLGLTVADHASGMGQHVPVELAGQTDVPGVWVAGNLAEPMAQVGAAAAAGALAGAHINADLIAEETAAAVTELRARRGADLPR